MNYYPFHVGDYASATRHLSWDEDAAYRRLLDVYYTLERPIPADKVYRLTVATSKIQREAVATVLGEFFIQTPEGWQHERCDQEIDAMRIKLAAQDAKNAHESDRMKRYRERRAAMFDALRAVDIVPAWDVPVKELQRLFDTHCNKKVPTPETDLQREQAIAAALLATAISPNPNTNTNPNTITKEGEEEAPDGAPPPSMAGAICVAMKSVGLASVNPSHPDLRVLIESGAEIGVFVDAAREAVAKQKPFAYVLAMVKGRMADAAVLASAALAAPGLTGNTALNKQELLEAGNMAAARRFAERAR